MKTIQSAMLLSVVISAAVVSGCSTHSGSAGLGALGGAVASAGGYEFHLKRQLDQLEDDYEAGKIDQQEFEIRRDQIKKGSIFQ